MSIVGPHHGPKIKRQKNQINHYGDSNEPPIICGQFSNYKVGAPQFGELWIKEQSPWKQSRFSQTKESLIPAREMG